MAIKILKFLSLSCIFTFCILHFTFPCYALNLDKLKVYFLSGDYKSSILEGERILASSGSSSVGLDELYYILGLSYLKDGNYLRASDIFEIILKEFKDSAFKDDALLGLGDTYFLRGDYDKAQGQYQELIETNPRTKLRALVYYRLSQIGFKKGETQAAKEYLDKLKDNFPLNLEAKLNQGLYPLSDIYYTVQVGSFSNRINANSLVQKLIGKGYPAYIEEVVSEGKTIYRLRVGKLRLRQEVLELENKLSQEGYPTKIYP
jgi:tetratricopeptide (TPR) repeat protein